MILVSGGVIIGWTGSTVRHNSARFEVAALHARLVDLYPLTVLVVLAFLVFAHVRRRRRRESERVQVERVQRILEPKLTRDDVADEFLAQTIPVLRASPVLLLLTDSAGAGFQREWVRACHGSACRAMYEDKTLME